MNVKENVKNVDVWIRGLFIVVFGVIFYFLCALILLVVIFQFLMRVVTGSLNQNIYHLSESLSQYAFQILNYITFQSEVRPYPFSACRGDWRPIRSSRERRRCREAARRRRRLGRDKTEPGCRWS